MGWWSRLSLGRKLEITLVVLSLPVILALAGLLWAVGQLQAGLEERNRYRVISAALTGLQTALLNVESGVRGYALSGDPAFLQPYAQGRADAARQLETLEDSPIFSEALLRLGLGVGEYLNGWAEETVAKTRAGERLGEASYAGFLESGKARFDGLRSQFGLLSQATESRLIELRGASDQALRTISAMGVVIGVVLLVSLVVFQVGLRRILLQPLGRLRRAAGQIEQGDYGARVEAAHDDEVGRLAASFNRMAASLAATTLRLQQTSQRDHFQAELSETLHAAQTEGEVIRAALERLSGPLGAVNLYLTRTDGDLLRLVGWWGPLFAHVQEMVARRAPLETASAAVLREVIGSGQPAYLTDYPSPERGEVVGLAAKPVRSPGGEVLGVLSIVRPSSAGEWSGAERELIRRASLSLGVALERADNLERLERLNQEYRRSNQELEQFAYVASHDLQEPLRMISSYTQLLARRYRGQLDERADQYIHFAVDGANRMQGLIQDLLTYSRVGTQGNPPEPTEAQEAAQRALRHLEVGIRESCAEVQVDSLPRVLGDGAQLAQLFQNLIGNAIKYRHPRRTPRIRLWAEPEGAFWRFWVADNGLGIEPQYHQRIFLIFQRLHTKEDYPGSGIGLAIARKIVERHGGQIGLESTPGAGSRFWFTLPAVPA